MRDVTYSESTETALVQEARNQTALLAQIRQNTSTVAWVAIIFAVMAGLGCLAWLAAAFGK
ncbi:MAG: hypothetical protein JWO98_4736 [Frankiales bacterium]|nr:hypothetical protein [Frankiales bacterium]